MLFLLKRLEGMDNVIRMHKSKIPAVPNVAAPPGMDESLCGRAIGISRKDAMTNSGIRLL